MSLLHPLSYFTPEEYLSQERGTEVRHEYLDGLVYSMAGESPTHSVICFNLAVAVGSQIKDTPCLGFSPNMKVRAGEGLYAYPDMMVVCGEPLFHDEHGDVLLNPVVIFEVLSPSTERYDRGEKFLRYRTQIETLSDYVLVAQDRAHVERFSRRPGGSWALEEVDGLSGFLSLDSIDCRVALADIYDRVAFPEG